MEKESSGRLETAKEAAGAHLKYAVAISSDSNPIIDCGESSVTFGPGVSFWMPSGCPPAQDAHGDHQQGKYIRTQDGQTPNDTINLPQNSSSSLKVRKTAGEAAANYHFQNESRGSDTKFNEQSAVFRSRQQSPSPSLYSQQLTSTSETLERELNSRASSPSTSVTSALFFNEYNNIPEPDTITKINTTESASNSSEAQRARFFVLVKILFRYLKENDEDSLGSQARKIVLECTQRSRMGDKHYTPLVDVLERRLKMFVGPMHWRRIQDLLRKFTIVQHEKSKQSQREIPLLGQKLQLPDYPRYIQAFN